MKKKFKQMMIEDPIYRAKLSIFWGDSKEIKDFLLKNGFEDFGDVADGKYIVHDRMRAIVINKFNILTLTHELLHFCFNVFDDRGIPIRYENDEAMAYYFEMILEMVIKGLKKEGVHILKHLV